ncbi:DegV family protein [Clostridium sp. D33t1_170424_F3]|uniref:DegV family protein n=1 Tax=Clostridium sp. D33t1_170424_F3 TaxID=2787099 RepID=UPI0018AB771D|nr:DegV family protein [Clostridium sp. D33t1_170424_F3]
MNKDKVAVLTDSGGDIPAALAEKYHIYQIPLKILYKEREYLDGVDITANTVYAMLPVEIPKTSLPGGDHINAILDRIKADGYEKVFVVCISSGLSGTYNVMKILCEDYEGLDCYVMDTKNISIGSGFFALRAAQYLESGMGWEELIDTLPKQVGNCRIFFCVKTLEYLQKGGRIGLVAAALGTALNLKPVISCNTEGIYYTVAKALGRGQSIRKIETLAQNAAGDGEVELAIMHGAAQDEANLIKADLKTRIPKGKIVVEGQISPALGVHTGPGLLGIGVFKK